MNRIQCIILCRQIWMVRPVECRSWISISHNSSNSSHNSPAKWNIHVQLILQDTRQHVECTTLLAIIIHTLYLRRVALRHDCRIAIRRIPKNRKKNIWAVTRSVLVHWMYVYVTFRFSSHINLFAMRLSDENNFFLSFFVAFRFRSQ